jgi:hypothetical protein
MVGPFPLVGLACGPTGGSRQHWREARRRRAHSSDDAPTGNCRTLVIPPLLGRWALVRGRRCVVENEDLLSVLVLGGVGDVVVVVVVWCYCCPSPTGRGEG